MPTTSFTNDQMRQIEARLVEHESIIMRAREDAARRAEHDVEAEDLLLDSAQSPSVELEQGGSQGMEFRWHGYFRSQSQPQAQRCFAFITLEEEELRELVGEEAFLFEDAAVEPDDRYQEE